MGKEVQVDSNIQRRLFLRRRAPLQKGGGTWAGAQADKLLGDHRKAREWQSHQPKLQERNGHSVHRCPIRYRVPSYGRLSEQLVLVYVPNTARNRLTLKKSLFPQNFDLTRHPVFERFRCFRQFCSVLFVILVLVFSVALLVCLFASLLVCLFAHGGLSGPNCRQLLRLQSPHPSPKFPSHREVGRSQRSHVCGMAVQTPQSYQIE